MYVEDHYDGDDLKGFDIFIEKNQVVECQLRIKFDEDDIEKPEFIGRNPDGSMRIVGSLVKIKGKNLQFW